MFKMRAIIFCWLPVGIWMCLIFTASGDTQSYEHSSRLLGPFLHWLFPHLSQRAMDVLILCARKCAHLTEYAVLALLLWRALRNSSARPRLIPETSGGDSGLVAPDVGEGGWNWAHARISVLIVMLYAATDEFHQLFVATRDAAVHDVLIDTAGGLAGILLLWSFGRWRKYW
jgi:VanZ family protein